MIGTTNYIHDEVGKLIWIKVLSLDFLHRARDFASYRTRFGLVLSAVQFFSRSATGAAVLRELIDELSPVTLVNLCYQSSWLFSQRERTEGAFVGQQLVQAGDGDSFNKAPTGALCHYQWRVRAAGVDELR